MGVELILTVIGVFIGNAGLIFWMRGEARADWRHLHDIQAQDRKDILNLMKGLEQTVRSIHQEMKDFHGRLCAIEERRK